MNGGQFKTNIRNAWCDCIRGYAILLVCAEHVLHVEPLHFQFPWATAYIKGDTGVYLFYVLSGFLVTGILAREVDGDFGFRTRSRAIRNFFVRRIFRLQPSYLLFLALYAIFSRTHGGLSWWILFLPLSNWFLGPYITWHIKTLHIEETYYLCIGACCSLLRRSLGPLLLWLLVAAPIGRIALYITGKMGYEISFWLLDRYFPLEAFAVGGLLVLNLERIGDLWVVRAMMSKPATNFALAMLALLVTSALRPVKPFSYALLVTWPALFSLYSVIMILSGLQEVRFIFARPWLRKLGVVSYTVYLLQQFVLGPWAQNFGTRFSWLAWIGALVVIAILVPLWYVFVEKPITDVGARWFPRVARASLVYGRSKSRSPPRATLVEPA